MIARQDLEKQVIMCLVGAESLGDNARLEEVTLQPSDFSMPCMRGIFEAILDIKSRGGQPDPRSIVNWGFRNNIKLAEPVGELVRKYISDRNLPIYVQDLRMEILKEEEESLRLEASNKIKNGCDPEIVGEELREDLARLEARFGGEDLDLSMSDVAAKLIRICETKKSDVEPILTHIKWLDDLIVGFVPGDVIVVAAYSSHGKTALGMQMATSRAMNCKDTLIVSLEMDKMALSARILAQIAQAQTRELLRRPERIPEEDRKAIDESSQIFLEASSHIKCSESKDINTGKIRQLIKRSKARMVIVDYIGLMEGEGGQTRERELATISRRLKLAAQSCGVAMVILAQLNEEAYRNNREPTIHSIRDCKAIAHDADFVLIPHLLERNDDTGIDHVKFKLEKGRGVGTGYYHVVFKKKHQKFYPKENW